MTDTELKLLLDQMEIPQLRRDFTDPLHLRWLVRNLWISNKGPNVDRALQELKQRMNQNEQENQD
jgi:hypothetical protein